MNKEELRQEILEEQLLRRDFEYALDKLGFSYDNTVSEFRQILDHLRSLGWDITADELLQSYKEIR
jgi:hypothetical protein